MLHLVPRWQSSQKHERMKLVMQVTPFSNVKYRGDYFIFLRAMVKDLRKKYTRAIFRKLSLATNY